MPVLRWLRALGIKAGPRSETRRKACIAYARDGKVFVVSQSTTTAGVWIDTGPVIVGSAANTGELDRILRQCLERSEQGVAHPRQEDWPKRQKSFVEAVGAKSYDAFAKTARCVNIHQDGTTITLTPTRNGGRAQGFVGISEKTRVLERFDGDLAAVLVSTFDNCA